MSSIHGGSAKSIAIFRKKPAALAVYWIYCARVNRENAAWPSLRGLAKDTGWSVNACRAARTWLVEHGALERLPEYVRPDWREYPADKLARRQRLDKCEYYRPTGVIQADGETFPLLYVGQNETAPELEESLFDVSPDDTSNQGDVSRRDTPHVSPGDTSHVSRRDTELNTIEELDSSIERGTRKDSPAADAAGNDAPPAEHKPPTPTPTGPTKKAKASSASKKPAGPPKPEYWGDLVAETITAFDIPRGVGAKLAEQLAGVAAIGERAAHNCEPAAQVGDVTAFVKWFRREHDGIDLPTSAEALALWWHRYHAAAVKRAETVYANGMTQADVDARWAEMQAEMQGRERSQDEQEAYDYAMHLLEVA